MVTEKDTRISHSAWQHGTQWINGRNWSCWPQQIQKKGALVQNLLRNLHSSGKPQRCIWALAKKNHQKHSSVWQTQAEHSLSFSWSTERIPFYRRLLPFCLFRHQQWMSNVLSSPSKWKKWLCWFRRGLPSAAATGTRFSSRFSLWWSSLTWWLSVILRDILQVGQDVSCSSQDRRQELTGKHNTVVSLQCFSKRSLSAVHQAAVAYSVHNINTWTAQRYPEWAPDDSGIGFLFLSAENTQVFTFYKHACRFITSLKHSPSFLPF